MFGKHIIPSVLLSLLLIVSGQGAAFTRSQTPASGTVILCTGHGSVTIFTDVDGQPTSAPQLCPDCAQALLAILVPAMDIPARAADMRVVAKDRALAQVGTVRIGAQLVRAPPGFPFV